MEHGLWLSLMTVIIKERFAVVANVVLSSGSSVHRCEQEKLNPADVKPISKKTMEYTPVIK